ncbi:MAG: nucleotidyltransferase [Parcubacteria group bacterium]
MPTTVISAFAKFLRDTVNLDPEITKTARASRDWLISQIHSFEDKVEHFPLLYTEKDIAFGSFARNTKIRDLDDIDLMICIKAQGATYLEYASHIEITVPDSAASLYWYSNANTDILNSRMVINKFVSALSEVPHYERADIKRTLEAATLKLTSYTWNFDIVPCFFTKPEADGRTFYIIPDGKGHWKKTDPRKDRDVVALVNQVHEGNVLNPVRILKFWNKRPTAPTMPSYLLETMVMIYYIKNNSNPASQYVDLEVPRLLKHVADSVLGIVPDFKEIQGDLNNLSYEDKYKIQQKANYDYDSALNARNAEKEGDHKTSIQKWGEIFGPLFPTYG